MTTERPIITPRLICSSASDAIEFYTAAFGAEELERFTMPSGKVVHAALKIRGAVVSLADADPDFCNQSPKDLGGSCVLLTMICEDPDSVAEQAVKLGAEVVIPIEDRFYGHREGRVRDPFGHLWILSKVIEELPTEEIQRRMSGLG